MTAKKKSPNPRSAVVAKCLERTGAKDIKAMLTLFANKGMSNTEVADELGVSLSAVASWSRRVGGSVHKKLIANGANNRVNAQIDRSRVANAINTVARERGLQGMIPKSNGMGVIVLENRGIVDTVHGWSVRLGITYGTLDTRVKRQLKVTALRDVKDHEWPSLFRPTRTYNRGDVDEGTAAKKSTRSDLMRSFVLGHTTRPASKGGDDRAKQGRVAGDSAGVGTAGNGAGGAGENTGTRRLHDDGRIYLGPWKRRTLTTARREIPDVFDLEGTIRRVATEWPAPLRRRVVALAGRSARHWDFNEGRPQKPGTKNAKKQRDAVGGNHASA